MLQGNSQTSAATSAPQLGTAADTKGYSNKDSSSWQLVTTTTCIAELGQRHA